MNFACLLGVKFDINLFFLSSEDEDVKNINTEMRRGGILEREISHKRTKIE